MGDTRRVAEPEARTGEANPAVRCARCGGRRERHDRASRSAAKPQTPAEEPATEPTAAVRPAAPPGPGPGAAHVVGAPGRPGGRTGGLFLLLLVAAHRRLRGAAGPADPHRNRRPRSHRPAAGPTRSRPRRELALPPTPAPEVTASEVPLPTGRPADVLADWARQLSPKVGIDPVALQAYGYAELVLNHTTPGCALTWPTLAAIGWVESRHGQANGARLQPDGVVAPEIIGPPLNGQGGTQRIAGHRRGPAGPGQHLRPGGGADAVHPDHLGADGASTPTTTAGATRTTSTTPPSPPATTSARAGGTSPSPDWWNAILSYNDVGQYAQDVFDKSNEYGTASRT